MQVTNDVARRRFRNRIACFTSAPSSSIPFARTSHFVVSADAPINPICTPPRAIIHVSAMASSSDVAVRRSFASSGARAPPLPRRLVPPGRRDSPRRIAHVLRRARRCAREVEERHARRACVANGVERTTFVSKLRKSAIRVCLRRVFSEGTETWMDSMAEWSKAPALGAGPKGRRFEPCCCQTERSVRSPIGFFLFLSSVPWGSKPTRPKGKRRNETGPLKGRKGG